jgi:hypothetical protein
LFVLGLLSISLGRDCDHVLSARNILRRHGRNRQHEQRVPQSRDNG